MVMQRPFQVPVCWSSNFNRIPFIIHTQINVCIPNYDMCCTFRNVNYYVNRGMSVFQHTGAPLLCSCCKHRLEFSSECTEILMFQKSIELQFERSKTCDDFPDGEIRFSDLDIEQLGRNKLAVSGTLNIREPLSRHFKVCTYKKLTAAEIHFKAFTANFAQMTILWVLTLYTIMSVPTF